MDILVYLSLKSIYWHFKEAKTKDFQCVPRVLRQQRALTPLSLSTVVLIDFPAAVRVRM